ncbi:MAG: proton-conducting transporter membrane subunit, partial [Chloroflexota bacterium]
PLLGAVLRWTFPRLHPLRIVVAVVVAEEALVAFGGTSLAPIVEGFALDPAGRVALAVAALAALAVLVALADDATTADGITTGLVGLAGVALVVVANASLVTAATASTATAVVLSWGLARGSGAGASHRSVQRYLVWMLLAGSGLLFSGAFDGLFQRAAVPGVLAPAAAFFVVGAGIFVAALPFSLWLPALCDEAPEGAGLIVALLGCAVMAVLEATAAGSPFLAGDAALRGALGTGGAVAAIVGSFLALGEKRPGRAVAYLIGAGADFSLAGLASNSTDALVPTLWLLGAQALAASLVLTVLFRVGRPGSVRGAVSLSGLVWRRPLLGWSIVVGLLSLVGMPLTAGFVGRWETIEAAGWQVSGLAVGMLIASILGGLAILRRFDSVFDASELPPEPIRAADLTAALIALALIVGGIYPWPIFALLR